MISVNTDFTQYRAAKVPAQRGFWFAARARART